MIPGSCDSVVAQRKARVCADIQDRSVLQTPRSGTGEGSYIRGEGTILCEDSVAHERRTQCTEQGSEGE